VRRHQLRFLSRQCSASSCFVFHRSSLRLWVFVRGVGWAWLTGGFCCSRVSDRRFPCRRRTFRSPELRRSLPSAVLFSHNSWSESSRLLLPSSVSCFWFLWLLDSPGPMFGSVCVEGKKFQFSGGGGGVFPFRLTELSRRKRFFVSLCIEELRWLSVEWVRFCSSKGDPIWVKTIVTKIVPYRRDTGGMYRLALKTVRTMIRNCTGEISACLAKF